MVCEHYLAHMEAINTMQYMASARKNIYIFLFVTVFLWPTVLTLLLMSLSGTPQWPKINNGSRMVKSLQDGEAYLRILFESHGHVSSVSGSGQFSWTISH